MQPSEDVRQMLTHIADRNKRCQAARKAGEPEIGIFFVYNVHVLMAGTPLSLAGSYGEYGHETFWKNLQRNDIVPRDIEYDAVPRGRVEYDIHEKKFHVHADPCILKNRKALDEIEREFHLPSANTGEPARDLHYVCPGCVRPRVTKEQEEEGRSSEEATDGGASLVRGFREG